jgi:membrane-associated protein
MGWHIHDLHDRLCGDRPVRRFLPSRRFAAGDRRRVCRHGHLDIGWLLVLASLCAIAGDQLGYWIGQRAGQTLYGREDSFFFRKQHLQRAHDFYDKYGAKTIVLARFVPIVRTFAPPVAGAARMNYRRFFTFNVLGGILWVWSMLLTGYMLKSVIPNVENHIHIVIAIVVFVSILPGIVEVLRGRHRKPKASSAPESGA